MQTFHARVEVEGKPGAKKMQGVWLVTPDGERKVVSYRASPWWRAFEGRSVEAVGESHHPHGNASFTANFRVHQLRIEKPTAEDPLVWIKGEQQLWGTFERQSGAPGSKSEGETLTMFAAEDGTRFVVYELPDPPPAMGARVLATVHEVEPSPFVARVGGRYVWVAEFRDAE